MRRLETLAETATSFGAYWQEVSREPSLTADEEQQLAAGVQQHDEDALAALVRSQLALVVRYARHYAHLGVPLIDLVRDGNLALIEAARRYHPGTSTRFARQALWWVRQGMLHRVSMTGGPLGLGDADARTGQMVAAMGAGVDGAGRLSQDTTSELSTHDLQLLDEQWRRAAMPLPGAAADDVDLDDVAPLVTEAEDGVVRQALASDLEASLLELEPKERRALELRLGLVDGEPRSVDQVGDRLRVSAARAERLSLQAVGKLRRQRAWRSPLN